MAYNWSDIEVYINGKEIKGIKPLDYTDITITKKHYRLLRKQFKGTKKLKNNNIQDIEKASD